MTPNTGSTQASLPPSAITITTMQASVQACCRKSDRIVAVAYCTRSMSLISADSRVPVVCFWKNDTDRRRIDSYRSSRMSVIMPKPA